MNCINSINSINFIQTLRLFSCICFISFDISAKASAKVGRRGCWLAILRTFASIFFIQSIVFISFFPTCIFSGILSQYARSDSISSGFNKTSPVWQNTSRISSFSTSSFGKFACIHVKVSRGLKYSIRVSDLGNIIGLFPVTQSPLPSPDSSSSTSRLGPEANALAMTRSTWALDAATRSTTCGLIDLPSRRLFSWSWPFSPTQAVHNTLLGSEGCGTIAYCGCMPFYLRMNACVILYRVVFIIITNLT